MMPYILFLINIFIQKMNQNPSYIKFIPKSSPLYNKTKWFYNKDGFKLVFDKNEPEKIMLLFDSLNYHIYLSYLFCTKQCCYKIHSTGTYISLLPDSHYYLAKMILKQYQPLIVGEPPKTDSKYFFMLICISLRFQIQIYII